MILMQRKDPIRALGFNMRLLHALQNAGFNTVGDLVDYYPQEFKDLPGVGKIGQEIIYDVFSDLYIGRDEKHAKFAVPLLALSRMSKKEILKLFTKRYAPVQTSCDNFVFIYNKTIRDLGLDKKRNMIILTLMR